MNEPIDEFPFVRILGVRVHLVQIPEVLETFEDWIKNRDGCRYVVATGMHGVMEAQRQEDFKSIVNAADLFVPDGISLVWTSRLRGHHLEKRVSGADLMREFIRLSEQRGYRNFFYGDTEDTLSLLVQQLKKDHPNLKIAGVHSPPFRPLSAAEEADQVRIINKSAADVLWVGLGLPKQERWMFQHKDELTVPVLVGVGAAFKFVSGRQKRAPAWLGDHGLEWAWRFAHEPRRVWRRVLLDGPRFAYNVALEQTGIRKYK